MYIPPSLEGKYLSIKIASQPAINKKDKYTTQPIGSIGCLIDVSVDNPEQLVLKFSDGSVDVFYPHQTDLTAEETRSLYELDLVFA